MYVKAEADDLWMRRNQLRLVERTEVGGVGGNGKALATTHHLASSPPQETWISMSRHNEHLMVSSLMRHIVNAFSILQREAGPQGMRREHGSYFRLSCSSSSLLQTHTPVDPGT